MCNLKRYSLLLALLMTGFVVVGCSNDDDKDGGSSPGAAAPVVLSTAPADNAGSVPLNAKVVARFSKSMNAATINASTFLLEGPGTTTVTGAVSYDAGNRVATFQPPALLDPTTIYNATITVGAQDTGGKAMAAAYTWQFTTGTTSDTTAPTVTSTSPNTGATGVPLNQKITALFSEQMDSATINTTSFTIEDNMSVAVAGSVSCPGSTATFSPSASLAASTTFTARITVAASDLAGNPIAAEYVWTFETGTINAAGPAPVVLGTAGNFVILSKSGISTTGTTHVGGDIGVSPGAATLLTGFNETLHASGEYSESASVLGFRLYASDYTPPTPTNMTTAVLDMETAYSDAAGRVLPDFTELGAGNLNGLTLVPGLYKWGTAVSIPLAVTISGGADDVWIFQIAQDLTVGNGAIVTLSGGAQASNIFWQVAGQVTLGTTADFKGIVLCRTQIVLNTGAVMQGRALAQTAVTLDSNAVTAP